MTDKIKTLFPCGRGQEEGKIIRKEKEIFYLPFRER
jgi:hypothetical protein